MRILYVLLFLIIIQLKSQEFQLAKSIGGINEDIGRSIELDVSGNVYITGEFKGSVDFDPSIGSSILNSNGDSDIFIAKYSNNGDLIWANSVGGTGSDYGQSVVLDASGNIHIIGHFYNTVDFDPGVGTNNLTSNGGRDIFFAKYNNNGDLIWAKSIGGVNNDRVRGLALDQSGNVFLIGNYWNTVDFDPGIGTNNMTSNGFQDVYVAKYDNNGDLIWAKSIGGTLDDGGVSIALDISDNIYITGNFQNTVDFDPGVGTNNLTSNGTRDIFFAKYDNNGDLIWAKNIGGTGGDSGLDIFSNVSGSIYITGYFVNTADFDPGVGNYNLTSNGSEDLFFAKYDNNGDIEWAKGIGGTLDDQGQSIAVDVTGNIYITGYFQNSVDFDPGVGTSNLSSKGSDDIFYAKYDNNGDIEWAKGIGGISNDLALSIVLDATSYLYITGYFQNTVDFNPGEGTTNLTSLGVNDIFFAKYSQNINSQTDNSGLPNSGDGNGDGIVDSNQDNVNTILDAYGNSYITVFVTDGYALNDVFVSLSDDENNYIYPYGNVEFKINASQAEVKIYYHGIASLDGYTYRKLLPNDTYGQFENVVFSTETIGGNQVAVATLTLTDGGPGDYDGIVNGVIYDPGGPALPITSNIPIWDWWYALLIIPVMVYSYRKLK